MGGYGGCTVFSVTAVSAAMHQGESATGGFKGEFVGFQDLIQGIPPRKLWSRRGKHHRSRHILSSDLF